MAYQTRIPDLSAICGCGCGTRLLRSDDLSRVPTAELEARVALWADDGRAEVRAEQRIDEVNDLRRYGSDEQ